MSKIGGDSELVPWIRIVGPTGVLIDNRSGAVTVQSTFTAPAAGNYSIIASTFDSGSDATSDYQLSLTGGSIVGRVDGAGAHASDGQVTGRLTPRAPEGAPAACPRGRVACGKGSAPPGPAHR
ncbi:MAG: hypothetical protein ACT4P7_23035 [Gemmatimonadaceae bacterium]